MNRKGMFSIGVQLIATLFLMLACLVVLGAVRANKRRTAGKIIRPEVPFKETIPLPPYGVNVDANSLGFTPKYCGTYHLQFPTKKGFSYLTIEGDGNRITLTFIDENGKALWVYKIEEEPEDYVMLSSDLGVAPSLAIIEISDEKGEFGIWGINSGTAYLKDEKGRAIVKFKVKMYKEENEE